MLLKIAFTIVKRYDMVIIDADHLKAICDDLRRARRAVPMLDCFGREDPTHLQK